MAKTLLYTLAAMGVVTLLLAANNRAANSAPKTPSGVFGGRRPRAVVDLRPSA